MMEYPRLTSVAIDGYRPFREFIAELGPLEVVVGANGAGKSSLFEFLYVLKNGMNGELPPGLVSGSSSRRIYHDAGAEEIHWQCMFSAVADTSFRYKGALTGPYGQHVSSELLLDVEEPNAPLLAVENGKGVLRDTNHSPLVLEVSYQPRRLALGVTSITSSTFLQLKEYIMNWRFYSSFNIAADIIRNPVITEQSPVLREDAGNLSDVLQYLKNEHESAFAELNHYMGLYVPGFEGIKVKSYGAPGQVMAFWKEQGVDQELSLADLSDGIFRLLCWTVLCVMPNPPSLICIDEPDQGVHPRTLPILADLFKKASRRTQILLATHNSYFLSMFDLSQIAVMRKEDGRAVFVKPDTSKALVGMLEDFGSGEIERLHKSEELEQLP